jgi:polyhydroxybutyrate depolymerase
MPLSIQGLTRRCVVYVPRSYDGRTARPLVVALHAAGEDPDSFLDYSNWHSLAEAHGFIVLAPEGLPLHPGSSPVPMVNPRVWNSGQYGEHRERTDYDDVAFVVGAVDEVCRRWAVDGRRVYLAGYSNGGAMAFRLAAERADRFTALAAVSSLCWVDNPRPTRAIPTLVVHGNLDPIVPRFGGVKMLPWEVQPSPPVGWSLSRWATAIGAPAQPRDLDWSPAPGVAVQDYGPGASGGLVRVMHVRGQGHGYPGGSGWRGERLLGPDAGNLDATPNVWAFFQMWNG